MKGVHLFLADGFEDVEALGTCDVLRRGGVNVRLVSLSRGLAVRSSHGVIVCADERFEDLSPDDGSASAADVMIFPGGMPGSRNLAACRPLIERMQTHYDAGGTLAAICAAPGLVLSQLRDVKGLHFTCFSGFEAPLQAKGAVFVEAPAVTSGRIVTGRSAGHALAFGLQILARMGSPRVDEVDYALHLNTI